MLILDGVYTQGPDGPRFHRVTAPKTKPLERLLNRLIQRIVRRLSRDGLIIEDTEQPLAKLALNLQPSDAMDHLKAASTRYRIAVGQGAGGRTLTLKNPALNRTDATPKPFTANQDSFSLNCAVSCQPHQRDRLERLCRYITRPALCLDRLSVNSTGQVVYQLKNPFHDGTTHVLFSPADFIARLAALVPRPRANLTSHGTRSVPCSTALAFGQSRRRYHGVFAPASPLRQHIVPAAYKTRRPQKKQKTTTTQDHQQTDKNTRSLHPAVSSEPPTAPLSWVQRLKRVFNIDITRCPLCDGQLRVIEDVTDPSLIRKILSHVQQRAPPRRPEACAKPHQTTPDLFVER